MLVAISSLLLLLCRYGRGAELGDGGDVLGDGVVEGWASSWGDGVGGGSLHCRSVWVVDGRWWLGGHVKFADSRTKVTQAGG